MVDTPRVYVGDWNPLVEGILSDARARDAALSFGLFFSITWVMTVSDLLVNVLGRDLHFLHLHFEGEISGNKHTADGRNTLILRRKNGAGKAIHYIGV
jgi:hypothetical protein